METEYQYNSTTITARNVMVDCEGWLDEGVDVFIDGKFVGSLVGWSAKSRGLSKEIEKQFSETLKHY
jgi:hypothetical protein